MAPWSFMTLWLALGIAAPAQPTECNATPKRDLLPGIIAPMAGDAPVWFLETTGGEWQGANIPIKSVWILSKEFTGRLRVSGRLRGTDNAIRFRRGLEGPPTDRLSIQDPLSDSMIPGGAPSEVMKKFAFVSSYIYFPSAGCWEITSEWGGARNTVVVLLK